MRHPGGWLTFYTYLFDNTLSQSRGFLKTAQQGKKLD
jgi:hypothetical protein